MAEETKTTASVEQTAPAFTKKQVLNSRKYGLKYRDFYAAKLSDNKTYTHKELEDMYEKFFKRKIK